MISGEEKITEKHLDRLAYLYIRQSSPSQVRNNLESQRRQYELKGLLESLGWYPESIVVVDEDLGRTAKGTCKRQGFATLCGEVCEGNVGLIMSIETSRLARSNREWYRLLDFCAVCETVVAEPGRVYDPRDQDDRLQLGMKGLLNEVEIDTIRKRLLEAAVKKAERGELKLKLPVGLVYGPDGEVQLDPDENVQQTVFSVLGKFSELGTARKVFGWMLENGIKIPRRIGTGLFSEVRWQEPDYRAVLILVKNPRYAGAYVRGRTETKVKIHEGEPKQFRRAVSLEDWKIVIPKAHVGYISWEEYLSNQERLKENTSRRPGARGAPGRGEALLAGLIRCGKCSFRMQVGYRTHTLKSGKTYPEIYYHCSHGTAHHLTRQCQRVSAKPVDQTVLEAFFKALEPAELDVSVEAIRRLEESSRAAERHWQLTLERLRYEAEKARRQYDRVEPENRLVARELESRWEESLREFRRAEVDFGRWKNERSESWNEQQLLDLRELAKDVPALWEAESTKNEDRKELLRLLIEEVWVWRNRKERKVKLKILWKGGCQTEHEGRWDLSGHQQSTEAIDRIRELATQGMPDRQIAEELNREGLRRSDGGAFLAHNVKHTRGRRKIAKAARPRKPAPPREPGIYNEQEAAKVLGRSLPCLRDWIQRGVLKAERDLDRRQWRITLTNEDINRLSSRYASECEWTVAQAAKYLGIRYGKLQRWISSGKLTARRVRVGRCDRLLVPAEEVKGLLQSQKCKKGTALSVKVSKEV
jgi:excisionase family DNA binding protein